ncbi:MAG: UTP--glucose-1-phosphate uridylyltransferase, partial [Verrucomicrobia bacterium]|nr:UTP--glucose-1-phosphate uridylyltransferase [Verrucomicrobiota bacterium]
MTLRDDLANLPASVREKLETFGFDAERLGSLAGTLVGDATLRRNTRNRVSGGILAPREEELFDLPARGTEAFERLRQIGAEAIARGDASAPAHVKTFVQNLSLRLDQSGELFRTDAGEVSPYATGHGDLPDALRRAGHLARFRADGGKYVWITNLDNLGASIDPAVLGAFIDRKAKLMVEVCPKRKGDRGGIPVRTNGRLEVLEEFRLPEGFDATTVPVFNTNTFLVDAEALDTTPFVWTYFEVEKKVEGRPAIQFERLLQEMTAALDAIYLRIPRDGAESRFLPVKDMDELAARRSEIEAVARRD